MMLSMCEHEHIQAYLLGSTASAQEALDMANEEISTLID